MMLRLALVGMVAALGISVPSQPGCERWFGSAEAWATSLLAEWDTWEPSDGDQAGVVGTQGHIACEECQRARLRLLASAAGAAPTGDRPASKPESSPVSSISESNLPEDAYELGIWGELARIALEPPVAAKPVETTKVSQSDPDPADASFVCGFGCIENAEPAPMGVAAEPTKPVSGETANDEYVALYDENDSSCLDAEWAWNGVPAEVEVALPPVTTLADLPRDVFTPAPVTAETPVVHTPVVHTGVLVDLPRDVFAPEPAAINQKLLTANELRPAVIDPVGKTVAPPADVRVATVESTGRSSPKTTFTSATISCSPESQQTAVERPAEAAQPLASPISAPPRLGEAVELTRKAVYAWVSVLIGPDAAELSPR